MSHDKLPLHALHVLKPPDKKAKIMALMMKYSAFPTWPLNLYHFRTPRGFHTHERSGRTMQSASWSKMAQTAHSAKAFNEVQLVKLANCVGCPHRLGSLRSAPHTCIVLPHSKNRVNTSPRSIYSWIFMRLQNRFDLASDCDVRN